MVKRSHVVTTKRKAYGESSDSAAKLAGGSEVQLREVAI